MGAFPTPWPRCDLGAIDFISKPLTPNALRKVVAEVLARHEQSRPTVQTQAALRPVVTRESEFAANMVRAKRALNRRELTEAEVFLAQADRAEAAISRGA